MLAAVRLLNQIELVGETVRACLEALAAADRTGSRRCWPPVGSAVTPRVDTWRMPSSKTKRVALGNDFARDGPVLLHAVWHPESPVWLRELPAADVLRRVLLQNTKVTADRTGREVVSLRDADTDGLPPGRSRIVSPYDLDARWGGKRDLAWCGFELHISESCDAEPPAGLVDADDWVPDPPNLVTHVATTDASVPDSVMTDPIHQAHAERGVLPGEHYLDSGYPSADLLVSSLSDHGVRLVTPMLADTSPQARAAEGFDRNGFAVNWPTRMVTCPQGRTSTWWTPATQRGTDVIVVKYAVEDCQPCPVKASAPPPPAADDS